MTCAVCCGGLVLDQAVMRCLECGDRLHYRCRVSVDGKDMCDRCAALELSHLRLSAVVDAAIDREMQDRLEGE